MRSVHGALRDEIDMPDWAVILFLGVIFLIVGVSVLRFRDGIRESSRERRAIIERLERLERRLDER